MSVLASERVVKKEVEDNDTLLYGWKHNRCMLDKSKTNKEFYDVTGIVNSHTYSYFECRKLSVKVMYCIHADIICIHGSMMRNYWLQSKMHALCFQIIPLNAFEDFMDNFMKYMTEVSVKYSDGTPYKFVYNVA
jgi:hypothetical protein